MHTRPHRIVVVGYGIAGLTVTDALRAAGFDGELTVIGAERHRPYSRPALSKAALVQRGEMTAHELPSPTHDATELLGVAASGLDVARKVVLFADGREVPYDGLVIASGSRAGRLADHLPVADDVTEHVVRSVDDAVALRDLVASRPSVVVVGGGPLGMEVASGCLDAGCDVSLVAQGRPLTRLLGPYLAGVFVAAGESRGLTLRTASAVRVATDQGRPVVELADGSTLTADVLVSAVGDVPRWSGWLTRGC